MISAGWQPIYLIHSERVNHAPTQKLMNWVIIWLKAIISRLNPILHFTFMWPKWPWETKMTTTWTWNVLTLPSDLWPFNVEFVISNQWWRIRWQICLIELKKNLVFTKHKITGKSEKNIWMCVRGLSLKRSNKISWILKCFNSLADMHAFWKGLAFVSSSSGI